MRHLKNLVVLRKPFQPITRTTATQFDFEESLKLVNCLTQVVSMETEQLSHDLTECVTKIEKWLCCLNKKDSKVIKILHHQLLIHF